MNDAREPASRWRRLLAAVIDLPVVATVALLLALVFGAYEHHEDWVGVRPQVSALVLAAAAYLLVNGYPLIRRGQTAGKLVCGIRTLTFVAGEVPALWRHLLRLLPLLPVAAVFFHWLYSLSLLIDGLAIFLPGKRCLHDYLAGTQMVRDAQET